jgi:FAD/FMN-containing dehydrogenase
MTSPGIAARPIASASASVYYQACERIFRAFDGRPHWGKLHHLDGDTLGRIHPDWTAWWAVRDEVDPAGVFLNAHLEAMRPR